MARKIMMIFALGAVLMAGLTPELLAQGNRRGQRPGYSVNGRRDNWNWGDNDRSYDNRRGRRNPQDTAGKALARTGIGAGIGAGAGALLGGGKGALIGATAGAVGGLIYHESKVSQQRNRRRW